MCKANAAPRQDLHMQLMGMLRLLKVHAGSNHALSYKNISK